MNDYTYIAILADNTVIIPVIINALFAGLTAAFGYLIIAGHISANKRTTMAINMERWDQHYYEDIICDSLTEEEIAEIEANNHDWSLTDMRDRIWAATNITTTADVLDADEDDETEDVYYDINIHHSLNY